MKCKQCGGTIKQKDDRYVLSIMDDPFFCSRQCVGLYIREHQEEVDKYVEEYMTTKEVPSDMG